jgi:small-conductance mechanosensitive channel
MADAEQEAAASEWAGETREKLARLISILTDQQAVLAKIEGVYADLLERTRKIRSEYEKTAGLFEQRFAELEEERLLRRSINPLSQLGAERIQLEVKRLTGKVRLFFSYGYWQDIGVSDTKAYTLFLLVYFLLFAALETVLGFIRRFLLRVRDRCLERGNFWQYLTVRLVRRSLYLGGAILYIFLFPVKPAYAFTPFFTFLRLLAEVGIVILMARWGLNFLHVLWSEAGAAFYRFLHAYLKFLLYGIMAFGIVYYLLGAAICETCVLLVLIRLAFEVGLLAWSVLFWHRFRFYSQGSPLAAYHWFAVVKPLLPAAGYLIVLVGLFFEGIGYGAMATLWYTSLARTAAAFMWIVVLYRVLKEVSPGGQAAEEEPQPPGVEKPMPVRWLLIRLGKALLLVFAVLAVPMAWGAREAFLGDFFFALNYQVRLGDMQISFLDVAVAILIVLLTHTVVIIWKALLREKILARREMEPGLKDSITTITGYIGWVIGIVIVFRVIGVSAASLAVLFGAVGIGIGFGLQNIFNNFLSGIILLFERPIQVGDVVEINGVWGAVTKINVRATQVKTYDNADLIIPNADFISNQLTNWSFKDARVRRTITVGVAYGSDISLVRETLYEIAANNSGVYRRPQPDVLFTEFGESALIFQLRVWAHINYFLNVETEIRFEITEKFRELGIHIPFPQRDVYLKAETPEMREPSPNL